MNLKYNIKLIFQVIFEQTFLNKSLSVVELTFNNFWIGLFMIFFYHFFFTQLDSSAFPELVCLFSN